MTMLAQSLGWQGLPLMIICAAIDAPSAWAFHLSRLAPGVVRLLCGFTLRSIACRALSRAWFGSLFANDHDGFFPGRFFWRRTVPVYAPFPFHAGGQSSQGVAAWT